MNAPELGWWTWVLLVLVLGSAAVLSFDALRDLAVLCGVDPRLAPLLPVAIDAGLALSTRVWLDGRAVVAEQFARRMTLVMLAVTVAANALHSGLVASGLTPTWWTAVAVGAVPPCVVGSVVHLGALLRRQAHTAGVEEAVGTSTERPEGAGPPTVPTCTGQGPGSGQGGAPVPPLAEGSELVRTLSGDTTEKGAQIVRTPAPDQGYSPAGTPEPGLNRVQGGPIPGSAGGVSDDDRAAALIAEGAGRRRIARELAISEHAARELLAERRNGHEVTR